MAKAPRESSMVSITYQFIFSKEANIWNNVFSFEQDLSDFFEKQGLEANLISVAQGAPGNRMVYITKIDGMRTLKNPKGVDLRNKPGKPSQTLAKGFSNKLAQSYNKQYPGSSKNNKLLK